MKLNAQRKWVLLPYILAILVLAFPDNKVTAQANRPVMVNSTTYAVSYPTNFWDSLVVSIEPATSNSISLGSSNYFWKSLFTSTNGVVLVDGTGTNTFNVGVPYTLASNINFILPASHGAAGQVLSTDANGILSWINQSVGSGTNILIQTNGVDLGSAGTFNFINSGVTGHVSSGVAILGIIGSGGGGGEANVNGEISLTNATMFGLVNGKAGITNLLRSIAARNGLIGTNENGTNISIAINPLIVASQDDLLAASNILYGSSSSQTPYTSTHNAAGYNISNITAIALGAAVQGTEPIRIGTNVSRSVDAQILIARRMTNEASGLNTNGHAFSDSTVIARSTAGHAYNSFDARVVITNAAMDHYAAFQAIPQVDSGTVSNIYGLYVGLGQASGTIRTNTGVMVDSAPASTIVHNQGIRLRRPTGSAPSVDVGLMIDPRHATAASYHHIWINDDLARVSFGPNRDLILNKDRAYTLQLWVDATAGAGVDTELHGVDAFGTDFGGGKLTLSGGRNTGAGIPGAIVFSTSPYGASGSASNNVVERLGIYTNSIIIPSTADLRILGHNLASNYVWTATNATTGEGEWRAQASGGSGGGGAGSMPFDLTQFTTNGTVTIKDGVVTTNQSAWGLFSLPALTPETLLATGPSDGNVIATTINYSEAQEFFANPNRTTNIISGGTGIIVTSNNVGGWTIDSATAGIVNYNPFQFFTNSAVAIKSGAALTNIFMFEATEIRGGKLLISHTNLASSTSNSFLVVSNCLVNVPSNTVHTASIALFGAAVTTGTSNTIHPSWTLNNLPNAGGMEGALQTIWRTNTETGTIVSSLAMGGLTVRADVDTTNTFGRVRFGSPITDIMYLAHFDRFSSTDFALRQSAVGSTVINSASGQFITFSIANTTAGAINAGGNLAVGTASAQALAHFTNSVAGTNVLLVSQRGTLAANLARFEHGGNRILTIDTNAIILTTNAYLSIQSGANQRAGNATLVGGTVTVNNGSVTANTIVMLTRKTSGGTIGTGITYTVSAGTSFTITSDNALDTSTFSYLLIEVP